MIFYKNFGLEDGHKGKVVQEIEAELSHFVDKVVSLKGNYYISKDLFYPYVI